MMNHVVGFFFMAPNILQNRTDFVGIIQLLCNPDAYDVVSIFRWHISELIVIKYATKSKFTATGTSMSALHQQNL